MTPDVVECISVRMSKVVIGRTFVKFCFIDNHKYWTRDQDLEMRRVVALIDPWSSLVGVMSQFYPINSCRRSTYNLSFPNWWSSLEPPRNLVVQSPSVFV